MLRHRVGIMFALVTCGAFWTAIAIVIAAAAGNKGASEKVHQKPQERSTNEQDFSEITLKDLVEKAKSASKKAYCPYSKFSVGAAVLTDSGDVFTGCNVENASYGLTICAERNAVFHMVSQAQQKIKIVVIYTPTAKPSAPCGACRQVINEFGPDAVILSACDGPGVLRKKLSDLLPDAFGPANFK